MVPIPIRGPPGPSDDVPAPVVPAARSHDATTKAYFDHSSAQRTNTDTVMIKTLKAQYPDMEIVVTPVTSCDLIGYAQSGQATYTPMEDTNETLPTSIRWTGFIPAARRIDGGTGALVESVIYGKFLYKWRGNEFIVYIIDGRDGTAYYPMVKNCYILTPEKRRADTLVLAAGTWSNDLHEEIWVFDQGRWQKSKELFQSVKKASWNNVILPQAMKDSIINDHMTFYNSRETYSNLQVPWKRGIIYYGPPGNGKTISIKATMNMLYALKDPVPTLYVRTLVSYMGPEYSIMEIFRLARQLAPCYLVFEDLDTIVTDAVRSYFLNEVDGLQNNDGIFMVGSTNHLDLLDPGISKRPSRFDRKYLFPDPDEKDRIAYCKFWQVKLAENKNIEFPDRLCKPIAEITDGFSFAYMQEAFVAALLAIARRTLGADLEDLTEDVDDGWVGVMASRSDDDLDKLELWVEIQKQIKILREGMEKKAAEAALY